MVRTKPSDLPRPPRAQIGASNIPKPKFPTTRTIYHDNNKIKIYGWPSRGGMIVLDNATLVDFDFLGFDTVSPPLKRDRDQDAEDEDRYDIVAGVEEDFDPLICTIEAGEAPHPTKSERRWVKVRYASESQGGGLWVAEYDNHVFRAPWHGPGIPDEHVHLLLARNMDERCEILKQLGARFLERVEDYDGVGCLRAWEEKWTGKVGPLVVTRFVEW
ncbi:Hypothetical protein PENO1_089750 [Penicillium occitanis (nom. inval.)]|nr:Hypothetical protein PENO1_089750 [Penicillium occitanis (nom. inval.)]PCH05959.1 hypothetical protein PENOC_026000 [Penicillium occitanis (nom. inval.)]